MSHFPKTLYRSGSQLVLGAHSADTLIVEDDAEFDVAIGDGWMTVDDFLATDPEGALIVGSNDALADDHAAVAQLLRDELLEADKKLRTEIGRADTAEASLATANDRIAALETENADLKAELAALDKDGDGNPGGSLPNDPPALTGKTKAELLEIAEKEKVTVEAGSTNAEIVTAIEAKRETDRAGA